MSPGGRRHGSAAGGGATRPRVGILGLFGVGNLGNDGSFDVGQAMVRELAPDADVICFTASPGHAERRFGVEARPMRQPMGMPSWLAPRGRLGQVLLPFAELRRWIDTYRTARRLALVMVPGTGILDDFGLRPQGVPHLLFRWSVCCRLARTPFAFVGIGAGPIRHPVSRRLMAWAARLATHRSYRDGHSASYMSALGAPGHYAPDVVFADDRLRSDASPPFEGPFGTIAVGLMSYAGWTDQVRDEASAEAEQARDYIERVADLVGRILDGGDDVTLLVGAASDQATVTTVVAAVEETGRATEGRLRVPDIRSLGDLCRELATTDGAVVTRYHNLVCALLAGRPVVSIGYEAKFDDLTESVGLTAFGHRAGSFDPERVVADLAVARAEQHGREQRLAERLAEFDALVRRDFASVLAEV